MNLIYYYLTSQQTIWIIKQSNGWKNLFETIPWRSIDGYHDRYFLDRVSKPDLLNFHLGIFTSTKGNYEAYSY